MLNLLCWNYKPVDFADLEKLELFNFLSKGDGTDLCWVDYHMGNYRHFSDPGTTSNNSFD